MTDTTAVVAADVPATPTGIAVLGSHPATVMQAPFDDPNWIVWACSAHNFEKRTLPRFDAWFELHEPVSDPTRCYEYLKFVESLPLVWMRDQKMMKHFPGAKLYPEVELKGDVIVHELHDERGRKILHPMSQQPMTATQVKTLGVFDYTKFTSTIAYMLAKAIVDCETYGIKRIGVWGVMQASNVEYEYQRPGIQYFLWEALRRGIALTVPGESQLYEEQRVKW